MANLLDNFDERTLNAVSRLGNNSDFTKFTEFLESQNTKLMKGARDGDEEKAVRLFQGAGRLLEQLLRQINGAPEVLHAGKLPKKEGVYD